MVYARREEDEGKNISSKRKGRQAYSQFCRSMSRWSRLVTCRVSVSIIAGCGGGGAAENGIPNSNMGILRSPLRKVPWTRPFYPSTILSAINRGAQPSQRSPPTGLGPLFRGSHTALLSYPAGASSPVETKGRRNRDAEHEAAILVGVETV